ncbi:MAG: cytochrome c biogenesis heme-transporting ATPase CcmA [Burkholderiales bacterium]|nr:cytochrome c biogenesis heme-transporting ATPase CcmA [Burkholderiales bacterium]
MPASTDIAAQGLSARAVGCERGGRALFESIDLAVSPGAALFLVGPNGSGKTTLLRALAGLTEPAAGEVRWNGRDAALRSAVWRMQLTYAGHKPGHKDELSVAENLELACDLDGGQVGAAERAQALQRVGLARRAALQVKRLSQGQKQRLTLARLSLSRRKLWLLDEPTAALDSDARVLLGDILRAHLARGGVALVATHDRIDLPAGQTAELRLGGA